MSDKSFKIELKTPLTATLLHKVPTVILLRFLNVGLMLVGFALVAQLLRQWAQRKALAKQVRDGEDFRNFPKPFLDQASTLLAPLTWRN